MRYSDFKIIESDASDLDPSNPAADEQTDTLNTLIANSAATPTQAPTQSELTTPEPPSNDNPLRNDNVLGNALRTLFMGLFGTLLARVAGDNPMFAGILRTILSGNSGGFDPRQVLGAAPAPLRPQVERVLQHVDPETGQLNHDGTNIRPAASASGWTRIRVGNEDYDVGNDFVRQGGVYATFSGDSARAYAREHGWIMPPREVVAEVMQQGRRLYMPVQDNSSGGDAAAHTQQIFELNQLTGFPSGLVWGHKKEVIESGTSGTRLMGGVYPPNFGDRAGRVIQGGSRTQHGGGYRDYSQGLRPCKRVGGATT